MEFGQKVGATILMGIPCIIGSVGTHHYTHSWLAVIVWLALMGGLTWAIVTEKFSRSKDA